MIFGRYKIIGKEVRLMKELWAFWKEEDAVAVVEVILILVVLIALVVIFKKQLVSLVNDILSKITKESKNI
jgi:Flp pilus assembly pilin Flp